LELCHHQFPRSVTKIFSLSVSIILLIDQIENNVKRKSWLKAIFDRKARLDREPMAWSLALFGLIVNALTLAKETG